MISCEYRAENILERLDRLRHRPVHGGRSPPHSDRATATQRQQATRTQPQRQESDGLYSRGQCLHGRACMKFKLSPLTIKDS